MCGAAFKIGRQGIRTLANGTDTVPCSVLNVNAEPSDPALHPRKVWLPPLRYSLPVIMLVSGLVLICAETALFLAFQERQAIDVVMDRAARDGARLARLASEHAASGDQRALERELEATRKEAGLLRVDLARLNGSSLLQSEIQRSPAGTEVVGIFPLTSARPPQLLTMTFDLAVPLTQARGIAWTQAAVTASVLALGSLLLWIALDSTVAKRAERIVAGARAMAVGQPPGPMIGGEDELAQIDHALRDAHAIINNQALDLQTRTALLEERTRERSRLEQEIIQISEREQRRIGQDLHDDVCQRLAAVKMKIQDHEEKLAGAAPALLDEAEAIANDVAGAIQITRSLARGLSPVEIDSGGIVMALHALAKNSRAVFGIDCHFDSDESPPALPHHTATQLYRIAQECIANAAKHARAKRVSVTLAARPSELVLRVANDGQPKPAADAMGIGMGLSIMHYRAESIGAALEFEASPADAITAVRCTLSLSPLA